MTLYDYLFNTPAWQRSAYVVTGLAIVGVLALGARVAISLRRRVPHYRALWLPIIVATIAIVFYTEAFLLGGMWATREDPAVREHIATVGWLWSALEAFTFPPWLHIKVAL